MGKKKARKKRANNKKPPGGSVASEREMWEKLMWHHASRLPTADEEFFPRGKGPFAETKRCKERRYVHDAGWC